eukprot:gb/GECG01014940.1/.p1 GENE.gb/GECG01014940.1/~~gb/GECG01014940.1/.p1  ORF type:complete len:220 (+),score=29.12 gb/GECG01014940.1/:1-660(+)
MCNHRITSVVISGSSLADGAEALGQGLEENKGLVELGLEGCSIFEGGTMALGRAVAIHPRLKLLRLRGNAIGKTGAQVLRQYLDAREEAGLPSCWVYYSLENVSEALFVALALVRCCCSCCLCPLFWNEDLTLCSEETDTSPEKVPEEQPQPHGCCLGFFGLLGTIKDAFSCPCAHTHDEDDTKEIDSVIPLTSNVGPFSRETVLAVVQEDEEYLNTLE